MRHSDHTQGGVDMDGTKGSRRWWIGAAIACAGAAAIVAPQLAQSQSAGDIGVSQPPVVTVMFGTSSSMQFAERGYGDFPELDDPPMDGQDPDRHLPTWESGEELNLPGSRRWRDGEFQYVGDRDDYVQTVGPCAVFHPLYPESKGGGHRCDAYSRPGNCLPEEMEDGPGGGKGGEENVACQVMESDHPSGGVTGPGAGGVGWGVGGVPPGGWDQLPPSETLTEMYDNPDMRLDDANMPRHIQIKQVLTGRMQLGEHEGPGCWFIPRFRGALAEEQICCEDVDADNNCVGDGSENFEAYSDHRDSIPHYQEVWETQLDDGLMDLMGSAVIFSASGMDGFRFDGTQDTGWDFPTNDILVEDPLEGQTFADAYTGETVANYGHNDQNDIDCTPCEDPGDANDCCHDVGMFRFIGPTKFDLDREDRSRVSDFVQRTILDAGFLRPNQDELDDGQQMLSATDEFADEEGTAGNLVEENPDGDDEPLVFDYPMHRQAMGGGSPFGGLFHDLHRFYLDGQHTSDGDGEPEGDYRAPALSDPDTSDPRWEADPYRACRARHSVLFTDGISQPEAWGGAGDNLGWDHLRFGAGGFDEDRFPYEPAEDAIRAMLADVESQMGDDVEPAHEPRVHVVGANVEDLVRPLRPDADDEEDEDALFDDEFQENVLDKVGSMAYAGRTCAQYYLPYDMVPDGYDTGPDAEEDEGDCDWEEALFCRDNPDQCDCDEPDPQSECGPCLVPQAQEGEGGWDFQPPDEDEGSFECDAPALVLTHNDREAIRDAFRRIFNEIANMTGLSAQTAPSITSYVDDPNPNVMGQYRLFSGLEITAGNTHYKGLLNRQYLGCDSDVDSPSTGSADDDCGEDVVCLHEQVNHLRNSIGDHDTEREDVDGDRRRVFTSLPKFMKGYLEDDARDDMDGNIGSDAGQFFDLGFPLYQTDSGDDVLGDYHIDDSFSSGDYGDQVNTREAFDHEQLEETFEAIGISDDDFYDYWNVAGPAGDEEEFRQMVDEYRGRIADRYDRMFGPVYTADPVTVGPPDMDLPIDSYEEFSDHFQHRHTMTYATTVDGQLRAIHTGERDVLAKTSRSDPYDDDASASSEHPEEQREAWAYIPQLVHTSMFGASGGTSLDGLMDGAPQVTDIRLCQGNNERSTNQRVCPTDTNIPPHAQWRTVLAQGMGQAGSGYFALDVTRSGARGDTPDPEMPDPIPMWEFGAEHEMLQTTHSNIGSRMDPDDDFDTLYANTHGGTSRLDQCKNEIESYDDDGYWDDVFGVDDVADDVWKLSFLGSTIAEPEMGTVNIDMGSGPVQRPVAVVGAGTSANTEAPVPFTNNVLEACTDVVTGRAIYVLDLQSGEVIRRFVDYNDGGTNRLFENEITGTPVLSGEHPADVSTRGFVGDEEGRMFRIDLTDPDPSQWQVNVFFDPAESNDMDLDNPGPAAFQPAVTTDMNRELVLLYGLGERGDTAGTTDDQAMIAIKEEFDSDGGLADATDDEMLLWHHNFEEGENLTGEPIIFAGDVYFTTYAEPEDRCEAGHARIYRLAHDGIDPEYPNEDPSAVGRWNEASFDNLAGVDIDNDNKWFGPEDPTIIRGMAITMGATCVRDGEQVAGQNRQPQLVAQTGEADVEDTGAGDPDEIAGGAGDVGGMGELTVDLDPPETRSLPLSWSIIEN